MIALLGMALFAVGIARVRSAVDPPSAYAGLFATAAGFVVMALGFVIYIVL